MMRRRNMHHKDHVTPHLRWLISRAGLSMLVALTCSAVRRVLMELALPAVPRSFNSWQASDDSTKRASAVAAEGPMRLSCARKGGAL